MSKTFLFQAIQLTQTIHFSISMLLVLFNPEIGSYQVLPFQVRVDLGAMAMKGVLHIPQSSSTAGTSPSDCLVSYPGHSLGGVLPLCRVAVSVFLQPQLTGLTFWLMPLGKVWIYLSTHLWVKKYLCCSSTRMILTLNNP